MDRRTFAGAIVAVLALIGSTACSRTGRTSTPPSTASQNTPVTSRGASPATLPELPARFNARGSVEQVSVTDAAPNALLELRRGAARALVSQATADDQGSLVFRDLAPGDDYVVRVAGAGPQQASAPLKVLSVAGSAPESSFYRQQVPPGYGYVTTRDGTKLAVNVVLPGPIDKGPYPTVIEYSGYDPARPAGSLAQLLRVSGSNVDAICAALAELCRAVPSQPSSVLALLMGFAVVGVNMRGTGCSGGAYDYFEDLQLLDGYDVIETVAANGGCWAARWRW